MKHTDKRLWFFASCIVISCLALWFVFLRLAPSATNRKGDSKPIVALPTSLPEATATPTLDERGTIIYDWKKEHPEAANVDWLNEGVWLKGARPFYHPPSFSPDGRWIVGGTARPFLWDARTGENKGTLGRSFYGNVFTNFKGVSFISNQEIALLQNHQVTVFALTLLPIAETPKRPFYHSIGGCGPTSKQGIWTYSYDIYDANLVKNLPKAERRLRYWDYKNARFTRVLPASLLEPVFSRDSRINMPVKIRENKHWLAVERRCYGIFVLNRSYKKVWQEIVSCPPLAPIITDKELPILADFQLGAKNILYLLDQNKGLRRVNLKNGEEYKAWPLPNSATSFALSDDNKFWAFGNEEGRLLIVEAATRKIIRNRVLPFSTEDINFSPDGSSIAVGGLVILPVLKSIQKD